jgi:hypothetical protein
VRFLRYTTELYFNGAFGKKIDIQNHARVAARGSQNRRAILEHQSPQALVAWSEANKAESGLDFATTRNPGVARSQDMTLPALNNF